MIERTYYNVKIEFQKLKVPKKRENGYWWLSLSLSITKNPIIINFTGGMRKRMLSYFSKCLTDYGCKFSVYKHLLKYIFCEKVSL